MLPRDVSSALLGRCWITKRPGTQNSSARSSKVRQDALPVYGTSEHSATSTRHASEYSGDLAQLRWSLVESRYGLELHSPRPQDDRVANPAQSRQRKAAIRNELRPRVLQQFSDRNVRKFIRKMECPPSSSKRKSIEELIATGRELQERLRAARRVPSDDPAQADKLRAAIQPYLQLVDDSRDDRTGILLRDIWRYFRYTWSIPQTPIPGRNLRYLVRDAAHKARPIVGIAALNNCAVQVTPRDRAIGWSVPALLDALSTLFGPHEQRAVREARDPALRHQGVYQALKPHFPGELDPPPETKRYALERIIDWLLEAISTALDEIEPEGLVTQEEVVSPSPGVIDQLRHLGRGPLRHADSTRWRVSVETHPDSTPPTGDVPVDDDVLRLENKHSTNRRVQESRRMLVRKKRALELARLLDARRVIVENRDSITDPSRFFIAMEQDEVRVAVNTAFNAIKSRRIGTNLLEITTCGAVAPYNRMLGGKLVSLLLLSPEVARDNQRRYGHEPTIIRSQLKNVRVVPDSTLVWLGTTSLFSHGSSQYERLRLPAGIVAADQPEIRYTYLGNTTGYGTVQFADNTVRALERVMRNKRGYREVNSVFGEGSSPRMRKLRSGLDAIGFNAELTMLHHQERRVYGAPLFDRSGAYLCGFEDKVPGYLAESEEYDDATERIAEFWRRRWLSSRLAHEESWLALGETGSWRLSSTVSLGERAPLPDAGEGDSPSGGGGGSRSGDEEGLEFWRRLARAGSNVVSEGLTENEFDELHIPTSLEDYLLERANAGQSILLTGNAGDGKTHLARALQRRLAGAAERFEFALDATALMSSAEGVMPIVALWQRSNDTRKRIVLAINQYPLYLLRQELRSAPTGRLRGTRAAMGLALGRGI